VSSPLTLLAALLCVFGLGALGLGAERLVRALGSEEREVTGRVRAHELIDKEVTTGGRSATRRTVRMARVYVTYEAGGASRELFVDRAPELALKTLPVGAELPVYVDVRRPEEADLEPGGERALAFVLLAAGALLAAAAVVFFLLGR
jgi:hypothetical protein